MVLVGDTAHGMSPNMAKGGALAFEDALVLAGCLRDAATVTDAVAAFVARRSPHGLGPHLKSLSPNVRVLFTEPPPPLAAPGTEGLP
jgi:2-polyprenyl-6-methoxyphenol hydroxylase-like FAD-dependent oxidoreductase